MLETKYNAQRGGDILKTQKTTLTPQLQLSGTIRVNIFFKKKTQSSFFRLFALLCKEDRPHYPQAPSGSPWEEQPERRSVCADLASASRTACR